MKRLIVFLVLSAILSCEEEPEYYEIPVTIISPEDRSVFNEGDTVVIEVETWSTRWQADEWVVFSLNSYELGAAIDSIYPYRYELDTEGLGSGEYIINVGVSDIWANAGGGASVTIIIM